MDVTTSLVFTSERVPDGSDMTLGDVRSCRVSLRLIYLLEFRCEERALSFGNSTAIFDRFVRIVSE